MMNVSASYTIIELETEEFVSCKGNFCVEQKSPHNFTFEFGLYFKFKAGSGEVMLVALTRADGESWASIIGDMDEHKQQSYSTAQWLMLKLVFRLYNNVFCPKMFPNIKKGTFSHDSFSCEEWMIHTLLNELE